MSVFTKVSFANTVEVLTDLTRSIRGIVLSHKDPFKRAMIVDERDANMLEAALGFIQLNPDKFESFLKSNGYEAFVDSFRNGGRSASNYNGEL